MMGLYALASLLIVSPCSAKVVERIVAIVNDDIITQSDLDRYQARLKKGGLVDESLLGGDTKKLLQDRQALINHIVDEKILDSEVKRRNLGVTIEATEQEIRNIAKRNQVNRAQLKQALGQKGIEFSEYQDFIKHSLERNSLIEKEISQRIKVSNEDVAADYAAKNGHKSTDAFEYTLGQILLLASNGGKKEAHARAEGVRNKLRENVPFEKLAAQFSEDPNFSQGGLLGTFKSGEMLPEIEKGIARLQPGQYSDVIDTKLGSHIVKVLRRSLTQSPKFEQERENIRMALFNQAFKAQFRSWLDQKRHEAFIRIN